MTAVDHWAHRIEGGFDDPAGRIVDVTVDDLPLEGYGTAGVATIRFTAEDFRGGSYTATGRILLPVEVAEGASDPLPTWFCCGYQLPDLTAVPHLRRGRAVVIPVDPVGHEVFPFSNPLCRGPNSDYVLAHLVRGASFVDPDRLVYSGGSAGGYAALLVAAEAFPVVATVVNVPVVNLTYEGAYFMYNCPRIAADPPAEQPLMGLLMTMFKEMLDKGLTVGYGADVTALGWFEHSPIAHLDRITGPTAACFSTADFLVPIEQVSAELAATTLADLPAGVVMAAEQLTTDPRAALRLVDVLGPAAEVTVVAPPPGAPVMSLDQVDFTMSRAQPSLPVPAATSAGQQWLVTVVDEGPTVFGIGHTKHGFEPDFEDYVGGAIRAGIAEDQLTEAKLEQLLGRWVGKEWLAEGFHHLDRPAAERADVERGLRRYCSVSPTHRRRFAELYSRLPADRQQVLPAQLVAELGGSQPG